MASEIRVDKITSLSGVGTISPSPTGVEIAGITTVATLKATTGIITSLTSGSLTSLGAVSGTTGTFTGDVDIADKIVHTGDTNTAIRFPAADTITAETGGSERLRINSAGLVGIGTDNPLAVLHVEKSGTSQVLARFESNMGTNDNRSLALTSPTSDSASLPFTFSTGNSIQFKIDAHIVHIDPDGRLGIGTDSVGEDLVIHDVSPSLKLTSTSTVGNTNIYFGDMDGSTQGRIQYHNNGDFLRFYTNGDNERLRIASDGKIGINTTTGTNTVNIGGAAGLGFKFHNFTSGNSSYITVESGDKLQSNVGGSGYYTWVTGGSEKVRILNTGGITFNGDTSTDNALDDYEEGNWTPKQTDGGTNFTTGHARYTKIGRIVHLSFDITRNTTGNTTQIWGLPFLPSAYSSWTLAYYAINGSTTNTGTSGYIAGRHGGLVVHTGGGYLHTRIQGGTAAWNITPDDRLIGSATYETAA